MDCISFVDMLADCNVLLGLMGTWLPESTSALLAQAAASEVAAEVASEDSGLSASVDKWLLILGAFVVIVAPFYLGGFLAKRMKMPTHGVRLGLILVAVSVSVAVLASKLPGLGVDLVGGTILQYEIDPGKRTLDDEGQLVNADKLVEPLTKRINPSGTSEIVVRAYGDTQVEIIIPEKNQREVAIIEDIISKAGILQFAIVANGVDHQELINVAEDRAKEGALSVKMQEEFTDSDGRTIGKWVVVDREVKAVDGIRPLRLDLSKATLRNADNGALEDPPSGDPVEVAKWMEQNEISDLEILMVINPNADVTGEDLAFARAGYSASGAPAVNFTMNSVGSRKFGYLTGENLPDGNHRRQLGIVMDDRLLSAPTINSRIDSNGEITGSFTTEEVQSLVNVLQAGKLPSALSKQPIARNQIDATLGADTISKGVWAIGVSLGLVLLFILFYYRFAGLVACTALVLNLAMILATMVLINQPLTLPGLAGLVLTVGMSVDANVLIFERIREELSKGAKDRMAIRNGFGKASITIIDANLTTMFTAIVLYAIGTDQIRGFAVTLILGILFSMFTAIYMSRTLFDMAERFGKLSLGMSDGVNKLRDVISAGGTVDFIGKAKITMVISLLLIIAGVASLAARGRGILDIDFVGGSSIQFRLAEPSDNETVRNLIKDGIGEFEDAAVQTTTTGVTIEGTDANTVFKVDSSLTSDIELQDRLVKIFEASSECHLVTYSVTVTTPEADSSALPTDNNGIALVAVQDEAAEETVTTEETEAAADDSTDAEGTGEASEEASVQAAQSTVRTISFSVDGDDSDAAVNASTLIEELKRASEDADVALVENAIVLKPTGEGAADWKIGSEVPFATWRMEIPLDAASADKVLGQVSKTLGSEPVWMSSSQIGGRVAGQMQSRASVALFASLLVIILYIWFRFQRVVYGLAAVVALIHDVLITLGAIAISFYVADYLGFLQIDQFKISLTVVAALLTIIGYSLNDTIVVFDRIRETKGKAAKLTAEMINHSINQTLSRTLLTSLTTLIVVVLLYFFGGEGIHAFAFALVVGVMVGTYSSIFVASPVLLWLLNREDRKAAKA